MIWKPECSQGVEPSRIWAFWITTKKKLSLEACYKYDSICRIYIENVKRKQKLRWDSYELQNCRQMCACPVLYLLLTSLCLTQPSNPPLLPRPLERNSWRFLRHAWYLTVEEDRKVTKRSFHFSGGSPVSIQFNLQVGLGRRELSIHCHLHHMHPRKKCLPGGATVNLFSLLSRCPWMSSLMEGEPFRRNDSVEVGSGGTLNKLCR